MGSSSLFLRTVDLIVKGLKTKEDPNFIKFFTIVQSEAEKMGKTFFLDCGDGNEASINGMSVCDMFGWLIPPEKESDFIGKWKDDNIDDVWDDEFVSVTWNNENGRKIFLKSHHR